MKATLRRRYVALFAGSRLEVACGGLLAIVAGLALVPIPLLVGLAFDRVIPSGQVTDLVWLGATLIVLQGIAGACTLATRVVVLRVTKRAVAGLRRDAMAKLFAASRGFYSRHPASAVHDLVVFETERVDAMSNALLAEIAPAIVLSLGVCTVLLGVNWWLFVIMAAVLPANLAAGRLLGRRVRARTRTFHRDIERFSRGVLFTVRAADLIKIEGTESLERQRQATLIGELRQTSASMAAAGTTYTVTQQVLIAVAGAVVLVAGGAAVVGGTMTPGRLLSFFAGLVLLRMPLNTVMASLPRVIEGAQSWAKVVAFIDDDDRRPYSGTHTVAFTGRIALHDVTFAYDSHPVLNRLSLAFEPGETVALVGPNGAGKSTIVHLILGFYRPQAGSLTADDVPYDAADLSKLRREIGVVAQEPMMVPGTIRDNLLYGADHEPWEAVLEACGRTGVDRFVSALPLGYDTPVGEGGELLSGGQRQRLSIARALLGRPKLLILDEPMNHLDEASGAEFFERLVDGHDRPTILLISHRPDVVSAADRVVHIDGGRVVHVDDRQHAGSPRAAAARA